VRIVQVDAFTDTPFSGNPAAVCVLTDPADDKWMQDVAREMNLSETAFLVQRNDEASFDLRWFTPAVEVELCGHATLASAHVLWEDGRVPDDGQIDFHTRWSGVLSAKRDGEWIELNFPSRAMPVSHAPSEIVAAVGGSPVKTGGGNVGGGFSGYLLEYASEDEVLSLQPDFGFLARRPDGYVTATAPASTRDYDFVSRFFASPAGIDEDPVTGSAHCALGPWWGERLGKTEMLGYQASARGGTVRVRLAGDRVLLGGRAVTVLRGELV
jgi:predicted PhzF superfamily epimerase YddE/YHI9